MDIINVTFTGPHKNYYSIMDYYLKWLEENFQPFSFFFFHIKLNFSAFSFGVTDTMELIYTAQDYFKVEHINS